MDRIRCVDRMCGQKAVLLSRVDMTWSLPLSLSLSLYLPSSSLANDIALSSVRSLGTPFVSNNDTFFTPVIGPLHKHKHKHRGGSGNRHRHRGGLGLIYRC